jgi:hypothetical protein
MSLREYVTGPTDFTGNDVLREGKFIQKMAGSTSNIPQN